MHRRLLLPPMAALLLAALPAITAAPAAAQPPAAATDPAGPGAGGPLRLVQATDYILPDSDRRRLTAAELAGMSRGELRLARNEIYARHGYIFNSRDLQAYFGAQPWYRPVRRHVALSEVENANVALIQSMERFAR